MKKIFLLPLALILLLTACATGNSDVVLTINKEEINRGKVGYYLFGAAETFEKTGGEDIWETDFDGRSAKDVAKENALDTIKMAVIVSQKAESLGISLTDEEKATIKESAASNFSELTEEEKAAYGVTVEDVESLFLKAYIYSKTINKLAEDIEIDNEEFAEYFSAYAAGYKESYTQFAIQNILVSDEETASLVAQKASSGEDFKSLIAEYEMDEDLKESDGAATLYKSSLESIFNIPLDMTEGEVKVIPSPDGYYIIKLNQIISPTDSELEEIVLDSYKAEKASEALNVEYEKWLADSEVSINEKLWNEMEIITD